MPLLNQSAYRQWVTLLLLYFVFTPTVYALEALFAANPTSGPIPLDVLIDARPSKPSPKTTITDYKWSSGDGHFMLPIGIQQITYTKVGKYTITLIVTDSLGKTDTETQTITALPKGTSPDTGSPDIGIPDTGSSETGSSGTGSSGSSGSGSSTTQTEAVFTFEITSLSKTAPVTYTFKSTSTEKFSTYEWKVEHFGVADPSDGVEPSDIPNKSEVEVTFTEAGSYKVTLTVKDSSGKEYSTIQPFNVISADGSSGPGGSTTSPPPSTDDLPPLPPLLREASFYGGVLVGNEYKNEFSSTEEVTIKAGIEAASVDIGKEADIFVVLKIGESYQFVTNSGLKDLDLESLKDGLEKLLTNENRFKNSVLTQREDIDIFSGQFEDLVGKFDIYIGYKVVDAPFVYNEGAPLRFEIQ